MNSGKRMHGQRQQQRRPSVGIWVLLKRLLLIRMRWVHLLTSMSVYLFSQRSLQCNNSMVESYSISNRAQQVRSKITNPYRSTATGRRRCRADTSVTQLYSKYISQLVSGATVDERFDIRVFPGPIRGIGTVPNINPFDVYKTIRPNTKIATIPAQNVLIVSNFRRDKYDYKQLAQQQPKNLQFKDFSMWDRDLAILLWKEYLQVVQQKKSVVPQSYQSPLTGYVEYLCQQDAFTVQENNPYYALYDDKFYIVPLEEIDIDVYVPPSTAPHTLRRWTAAQKTMLLSQYDRGQELIQISNQQERVWRMKYDSIRVDPQCSNDQNIRMSYEQFVWAMEVVQSRAFCGLPIIISDDDDDTDSSSATTRNWKKIVKSVLPGILAPLFAATIGYIYAISTVYPNEIVLMIIAMLGAIPLFVQLFQGFTSTVRENVVVPPVPLPFAPKQPSTRYKNVDQSAVLLPIIDSANHDPNAAKDTNIVYNPLQHTFEWMIGPQSFIESTNIERPPLRRQQQVSFENAVPTMTITSNDLVQPTSLQVCISYGKQPKSDIEWMINYGFLPGVSIDADIDNFDQYRYFLSQQFLERNP